MFRFYFVASSYVAHCTSFFTLMCFLSIYLGKFVAFYFLVVHFTAPVGSSSSVFLSSNIFLLPLQLPPSSPLSCVSSRAFPYCLHRHLLPPILLSLLYSFSFSSLFSSQSRIDWLLKRGHNLDTMRGLSFFYS